MKMTFSQDFNETRPHLFLVGFMGTGKTTCGKIAHTLLNLNYIQTDEAIEDTYQTTLGHLFKQHGEPYFRNLEYTLIQQLRAHPPTLVDCGGGLITNLQTLKLVQKKGVIIALTATTQTICNRLEKDGKHRPLLETKTTSFLTTIKKLQQEREYFYNQADARIRTDFLTPQEVAHQIALTYQKQAPLFSAALSPT